MKQQGIYIRFGGWVCLCALLLRLFMASPDWLFPLYLYLETGRQMIFSAKTEPTDETAATQAPAMPAVTVPGPAELPAFSAEDLTYVDMAYFCSYRPNLPQLISQRLTWDLSGDAPTVLIVHTHATESYAGTDGYRSENVQQNMISIGAEVERILEAAGISVIHDTRLHDYPSYVNSYSNSRKAVQEYLAQYPSIQLVLDLHRDASGDPGSELITSATVGGQKSAQLMMVIGTDRNDHWEENLSLALKLTAALEQYNPGICRPISLRSQRFNMDLSPGSLLVEVGAAGNSHEESIIAANALAQSILYLSRGTR